MNKGRVYAFPKDKPLPVKPVPEKLRKYTVNVCKGQFETEFLIYAVDMYAAINLAVHSYKTDVGPLADAELFRVYEVG